MQEFVEVFSTTGFPVAVSIFLLVRFENKITELSDTINELSKMIERYLKEK